MSKWIYFNFKCFQVIINSDWSSVCFPLFKDNGKVSRTKRNNQSASLKLS